MSDVDRFERRLKEAGAGAWESAPADLVAAVKALVPARAAVRLGFLRLGTASARDGESRRQAVLTPPDGTLGPRLRVAAERTHEGWEVVGRAEGLVQAAHPVEEGEDGAFRFVAPSLEETGFRVLTAEGVFEAPPLSEAP
ncbi:hypothetical protein EON79_09455 [bacterium]|nr:MAG: hypothetical protein EON79_09455 [bacterium]